MKHFSFLVLVALASCGRTAAAQSSTIDFGSDSADLPYTEDGLTFTESAAGFALIRPLARMNSSLTSASGMMGQIIRAESLTPFDLHGITVEGLFEPWRIETSAGGSFSLSGLGEQDFSGLLGFAGITYFDIINDGNMINALLDIDDVQVTFVPEPSTGILIGLGLGLVTLHRRGKLTCRPGLA